MEVGAEAATERAPRRRGPGRRRQPGLTAAILAATQDLLASQPFNEITVDAIAEQVGVSLPTIYRRWPTKTSLIKAAMLSGLERHVPLPDTGNIRDDLLRTIEETLEFLSSPLGMAFVAVVGAAAHNPEWRGFGVELDDDRRAALRSVIERAVERGELASDVDQDILLDLFQAHVWMSLFFRHTLPDHDACVRAVDLMLTGALAPSP